VRHHEQHAGRALGRGGLDRGDPSLRDRGLDDETVGGARSRAHFVGVGRAARDLETAVDAIDRLADQAVDVGVDRVAGGG
jgi:hypothetical protein